MDNCPVCQQRINRHAKQIACSVCTLNYHLKCITLCKDEIEYLYSNSLPWYCKICTINTFPFNNIEDDLLFKSEINGITVSKGLIDCELSELVFHPFELNDDNNSHWFDIDPYLNFIIKLIM